MELSTEMKTLKTFFFFLKKKEDRIEKFNNSIWNAKETSKKKTNQAEDRIWGCKDKVENLGKVSKNCENLKKTPQDGIIQEIEDNNEKSQTFNLQTQMKEINPKSAA